MDEILMTALKWAARGVGLALDYINLRAGIEQFRRDARRNGR
ncbi:hypothetical protein [Streptomyces gardneri]|uniref:Uncharacterized protein n=1 Tax=Streptomyces gardneri TaxID=66892 RepID=A0A4Y3RL71_9ACTN|nr:hypothetical protein [Streptomyces gardneri]GEB58486.1 hypothetical protein SGA01_40910 [Streptomyces gardneri]GHH05943.1 hypothetical protein GCM10017674_45610 [Streptomyces gardneri]